MVNLVENTGRELRRQGAGGRYCTGTDIRTGTETGAYIVFYKVKLCQDASHVQGQVQVHVNVQV